MIDKFFLTVIFLIGGVFSFLSINNALAAGLTVGRNDLNLSSPNENLFYGVTAGTATTGSFMLFERGYGTELFKIDWLGDMYLSPGKSIKLNSSAASTTLYLGNYKNSNNDNDSFSWGDADLLRSASLVVEGNVKGNAICIRDDCKTTWSGIVSGGGGWLLDGNTVGQLKTIGTKDNYDLPFIANNSEGMRLTTGGNLVIGTSTTGVRLHVESGQGAVAFFKSKLNGGNYSGYIGNGQTHSAEEFGLYNSTLATRRLAVYDITNSLSVYGGYLNNDAGIVINNSGNVGIGTTNPLAKLDVRGSYLSFNGSGTYHYRDVASINNSSPSVTGTLKITMPKTWSNTMMAVTIKGYNYSANGAWEVVVSGYNYTGTPAWVNTSVQINGKAPFGNVRLAHDGTSNVILLGSTDTVWTYPKVDVTDFIAGHSNMDGWGSGWSMSFITDEASIAYTTTPSSPMFTSASGNVGVGTTTPDAKLNISGTLKLTSGGTIYNQDSSRWLDFTGTQIHSLLVPKNVGIGTNDPQAKLAVHINEANGNVVPYINMYNDAAGYADWSLKKTGSNDLSMYNAYNNYPVMTWLYTASGGNVGIGTTNPGAQLEVKGNGIGKILIGDMGYSDYGGISLNGSTALGSYNFLSRASDKTLLINRPTGGDIAVYENNGTNQFIIKAGGSVGIGTSTPAFKLDVLGSINSGGVGTNGSIYLNNSADGAGGGSLVYNNTNNTLTLGQNRGMGSKILLSSAGIELQTEESTSPYNKVTRMIIKHGDTGNIGIGTTTPTAKLEVAGSIKATSMTLGGTTRTTWPGGVDAPFYTTTLYGANGDLAFRTASNTPVTMRLVYGPFSYGMPSCASGYTKYYRIYAELVDNITSGGQYAMFRIAFTDGVDRDFNLSSTWGGAPSYRAWLSGLFQETNVNHANMKTWVSGTNTPYVEIRKVELWAYCL